MIDLWLDSRRLPRAGALPPFTAQDVAAVTAQLDRALLAGRPRDDGEAPSTLPEDLLTPPPRLGVAFLRVMADMSPADAGWDERILALDPRHPVARRNRFLASLSGDDPDRRAVLPIVEECPMYGKPHLSVWGDAFDEDRPDEGMGLRHQGIAASLIPANPYACHNYSLQLAEDDRDEEAHRWCDRATVASPSFNSAHLDSVRRMRDVQRPGQAFAEAVYRCNDVLDRWNQGRIIPFEWPVKYHAGMLLAFVHFDIGRLDEAIQIAQKTMADLDDPEGGHESFSWAVKRIRQWSSDANILAKSYGWEGFHRGDPGRVIEGFRRGGGASDADEVWMELEALIALGREEMARLAFHHHLGEEIVGDGKARLAGARAEILSGDLDLAIEQIQIVQLRRTQGRLEGEINRLYRLAACRAPEEWEAAIARRLDQGALTLARRAARDIADFVPGMDRPAIVRALGERRAWRVDPQALVGFAGKLIRLGAAGATIDDRLARPPEPTLRAADVLAQEWWTVLPPPNKDREVHASAAVYALGLSIARYLEATSGPPSPIAGAYRHVATEALHLVRRARYQVGDEAVRALLELLEHCAAQLGPDGEWLFDAWLLRVEHALDLDNEYGAYLPALIAGLPRVGDLLRGDERIGWELRLAWDLRDVGALEPARLLYERCGRAMETGAAEVEWSNVADATLPADQALDVHWVAAIANPGNHAEPWLNLARAQLASGRNAEALRSLERAFGSTDEEWRREAIAGLESAWAKAGLDVPFGFDEAQAAGLAALQRGDLELARRCLGWCQAQDPDNSVIARNLGIVYGAMGRVHDAIRAFAAFDDKDPGKHAGTALIQAQKYPEAVLAFRYASPRFTTAEEWRLLAVAGWYAEDDAASALAYGKMLELGAPADAQTLHGLASALYHTGQWQRCEPIARQLIDVAGGDATYRSCGLHAMARALAGQGQFGDALRIATEAAQMNPLADNKAEFEETVRLCRAQETPPFKPTPEGSIERRAWDALADGDFAAVEQMAISGNSWGLFRAALAASEFRFDSDNNVPVPGKALDGALMVLDRTIGNPLPDACLARIRALRIRENAFIQIDPPPPMGARMRREEFEQALAQRARGGAPKVSFKPPDPAQAVREAHGAAAAIGAGLGGDADPVVFPGTRVARLSEYVALMRGMQTGDMMGALSRAGLDMAGYMQVATQWGQRLATDATLNARFTSMMNGR